MPDWGEDDESHGPKKSDADVARELQNQFNSELKGPVHLSLDDADELLARKLQACHSGLCVVLLIICLSLQCK